jgi:hypothetical protein
MKSSGLSRPIYAAEGVIPETFDKELLDSAWKVK